MNEKKWKLVPGKTIGQVDFGMDRACVRDILGEKYKPFKKSLFSKSLSDSYSGYHVFYSKDGKLVAIEFFEGVEISLDGKKVFPGNFEKVKSVIKDLVEQGDSYISRGLSIGITLSENEDIEAILVGCKGYYD